MAVRNAVQIQVKERARCTSIVREQRARIERALFSTPISRENKLYMRRFTQILTEIEHSILAIPFPPDGFIPEKPEYLGDFSAEEMERAQEIIAEQEQNPFEREMK